MDVGYTSQGWVGDDGKPLETTVTHVEFSIPGKQKVTIDDPNGIELRDDGSEAMPVIKAESVVVEDLSRQPNIIEKIQNFWHGLTKER